jgi:hypothetical protein
MKRSFDLCGDSGTGSAFFPPGRGAMLGTFEEVLCEGNWSGSEGGSLWGGSCMANDTTPLWPGRGCGNQGTKHSFACTVMQFWLMFTPRNPAPVSGWHEIWHDGTSCSYYCLEVYGRRCKRIQMSDGNLRTKNEKRERRTRNPEALLAARGSFLSRTFSTYS